jgi:hypothetical protein
VPVGRFYRGARPGIFRGQVACGVGRVGEGNVGSVFALKKAGKCGIIGKGNLLGIHKIRRCEARLRIGGLDEGRRALCHDG